MTKNAPYGQWKDIKYTVTQSKKAMAKHSWTFLPGARTLIAHGYESLVNSIKNNHGGFPAFRNTLAQENTRGTQKSLEERVDSVKDASTKRPNGTWKNREFALTYARKIMQQNAWKILPSGKKLRAKGHSSLAVSIIEYHGGFHIFRELLGEEQLVVKTGTWFDLNYTLQQAHIIMKQHGWATLPGNGTLVKHGHSSFITAVNKYHGRLPKFRKLLGQQQIQREAGLWKDIAYAFQQAHDIMQCEGWGKLPGSPTLIKHGYSSLSSAVKLYHGGLAKFRALFEKHLNIPSEKERLENLLRDYTTDDPRDGDLDDRLDDQEGYALVPA